MSFTQAKCSDHDRVRQCNQKAQTVRKSREGGQRGTLEKGITKWKENENLQEVNPRHREIKECC